MTPAWRMNVDLPPMLGPAGDFNSEQKKQKVLVTNTYWWFETRFHLWRGDIQELFTIENKMD